MGGKGEAGKASRVLYLSFATSHGYFTRFDDLKLLNSVLSTEQLLVNAQTNPVMEQFMKDGPQTFT